MGNSGADLVKSGDISSHRQITMADKAVIDVWVIKPNLTFEQLRARGSHSLPHNGTVILLHEMGYSKASFPYRGTAERLSKLGYYVVLMDLRTHGKSTGKFVTHGHLEKTDVKTVIDTLMNDKTIHGPVYASGIALGAVTAIQYAAIDPRCKGVMAIYPYKDLASLTGWLMRFMPESKRAAALKRAEVMANIKNSDTSSIDAVKKLSCPILIVCGLIDLAMPTTDSEEIHAAATEPKELLKISRAVLLSTYEGWYAEQIHRLATTGLKKEEK